MFPQRDLEITVVNKDLITGCYNCLPSKRTDAKYTILIYSIILNMYFLYMMQNSTLKKGNKIENSENSDTEWVIDT